jgi:predicted small lipoprotein YifL
MLTRHKSMKSGFRSVAAALCLLLVAAACGQKGPLYLPGDPHKEQIELPEQPPDESAEDDEHGTEDESGDDDGDTGTADG